MWTRRLSPAINDIYKGFINLNSSRPDGVHLSRIASVAVLVVGILFGLLTTRITDVMVGIVSQLRPTARPIYLVLRTWSWAGAIIATLAAPTLIIKFNWYDKLEKAI